MIAFYDMHNSILGKKRLLVLNPDSHPIRKTIDFNPDFQLNFFSFLFLGDVGTFFF